MKGIFIRVRKREKEREGEIRKSECFSLSLSLFSMVISSFFPSCYQPVQELSFSFISVLLLALKMLQLHLTQ